METPLTDSIKNRKKLTVNMANEGSIREFHYLTRADYDINQKIQGESISLYSQKKLESLYPKKDYALHGETWSGRKRDKAKDIGRIELAGEWQYMVKPGTSSRFFRKPAGYAETEEGGFITVMKRRLLPFLLLLLILLLATGITIFALNYQKPIDPNAEDPNLEIAAGQYYTITGTVTQDSQPYPGATLSLQKGNQEIGTASSDEAGAYLISNVEDGLYNLVCTAGNTVLTKMAEVEGNSIVVDYALPDSDVKALVKIADENTPLIAVDGLCEEAIRYAITGKEVDLTLIADQLTEDETPADEKAAIEEKSGDLIMTYYDFSLLKEIYADSVLESSEYLKTTTNVLQIAVPFDSTQSAGTYVFRYHNGASKRFEQLSERPTGDYQDGTYYATIDTVYIYTSRFSTYAIGYADAGVPAQGSDMIIFSDGATVNVKSRKVTMYYSHDSNATHDARVEIYLVGKEENLLVATSGIIPPGRELNTMQLKAASSELPSDASYEGLMRISYLGIDGKSVDTNVEIPITVTITRQ